MKGATTLSGRCRAALDKVSTARLTGRVTKISGLMVEAAGPPAQIGDICEIAANGTNTVSAEVVGIRDGRVILMPLGDLTGVGQGCGVLLKGGALSVPVGEGLIGRVIDGAANPIDDKGTLDFSEFYPLYNSPPKPLSRPVIDEPLPLGVKAIDSMLTFGKGQRMGIFAGSGVGKSTLLGMIAQNAVADVNVIVLVGERGREVNEFLERDLGEKGRQKSVVVVATSDQPAFVRLRAALVGTSIAEYFRDKGKNVLLLLDSLTRFAMAQRDIGLAAMEPPVARGYTPSVFSLLPKLLERSGTSEHGSISALYTVLVDGDDFNEPISDAVRGILDGHIMLSRQLANRNHFPAIDVLQSLSRVMPSIIEREHYEAAKHILNIVSVYNDAQDLINIGAYKSGANAEIDRAINLIGPINRFLTQRVGEAESYEDTIKTLVELAGEA